MFGENPTSAREHRRAALACLALIALVYGASLAGRVVFRYGGNVTGLFCIGDVSPVPPPLAREPFYIHRGWIGYDGQITLFLAYDPLLRTDLFRSFEAPAYRAQRIGLPLLAHVLVAGNRAALPYALVGINFVVFLAGCWFFLKILSHLGASLWWVFAFAFSPGLMASEFRVLFDAMSTSLVFISIWALFKERWTMAALVLCAAALVRETALVFAVPIACWSFLRGERRKSLLFLAPLAVYAAWTAYVRVRTGTWPIASGFESNFDWPMVGVVEKFLVLLPIIREINPSWPVVIPVEVVFTLGLLYSLYLAVRRLEQAPQEWLTWAFCTYAALAIVLSSFPWSRYWHAARVLEPLLLFPLLIHLQTREKKYLVPLLCAAPVAVIIFLSPR